MELYLYLFLLGFFSTALQVQATSTAPNGDDLFRCETATNTTECVSHIPGWRNCSALFNLTVETFEMRKVFESKSKKIQGIIEKTNDECILNFLKSAQAFIWGSWYGRMIHLLDETKSKHCQQTAVYVEERFEGNSIICGFLNISGISFNVTTDASSEDYFKFFLQLN